MNVEQSFPVEAGHAADRPAIAAWLKKRIWFILVVVVPTLIAIVYYGFIASDIYVSESRFVVKSADQKRPQVSTLANLIQTTGLSAGQEQANEILEFVRSRNAVKALNRNNELQNRFASPHIDFVSRFPQPFSSGSFEDLFKYYTKMVKADLDSETGTAILSVRAYTPADAFAINERLLEFSEALVNRLNARAQSRGIDEAQKQVNLAIDRAKRARSSLGQYRNAQALIDPAKQAEGLIGISNTMVAERAALQAQLESVQRATPNNPSIPAMRSRIAAISAQISAQEGQVVGSGRGDIASKLGGYEDLLVEQEFATENLNAANAALVQARNEAQRQQFYLERVVDPNLPDMPLLPRRMLNIIVVFGAAVFLYFIGWMVIVGILEHAPED